MFFNLKLNSILWFVWMSICLPVNAQDCAFILSKLSLNSRLAQVEKAEGKQVTEYRHDPNTTLSLSCTQSAPNVAATWDGPTPDATFYNLVGTAGNLLTQRPVSEVVKYSKQCRQEALKDDSEIATIELEGLAIECQAFKRDGGGTTITIFTE